MMFADDIKLVEEMVTKYGLLLPFADLGGLHAKDLTVADYERTIKTGDQHARYLHLAEDPFTKIAKGSYAIFNPQYGDPTIETMARNFDHFRDAMGTIVCLSVLEHVYNPFQVFADLVDLLRPGGLLILSTVLSFPVHDAPHDYWRFTDNGLRRLAIGTPLEILECGYRLNIHGGMGVKEIHTGEPQEVRSVYLCGRRT